MSIWDDAKKNLVEWYSVTADKTTELAKVTSLRYDKFGLSRDIERQFSELGSLIYHGLKEDRQDILAALEVTGLLERIAGLEQELRQKEEEIVKVKRDHAARKAAEAAAGGEAAATVLTDPVLTEGGAESAILMEEAEAPPPTAETAAEPEQKDKDSP